MAFKMALSLLVIIQFLPFGSSDCHFPAIYNFGDSNSATGIRGCDARLIIDFIGELVGLGPLNSYSNGGDFSLGANFATGGASIKPGGYSEFNLGVQISLFQQLKAHSNKSDHFYKSLYTLDMGQNDLAYNLQHKSEEEAVASIPDILDTYSRAFQILYNEGARIFWIHNTGPIGCLPYNVIYYPSKAGHLDGSGCVKPQNDIAQEFNHQLKQRMGWLRTQLRDSVFTYVDVYSAKYTLIADAEKHGFVDPMDFCCGSYYGYHVDCGKIITVNGTEYGRPCSNPLEHISWDGIHYSGAANQWVSKHILFGLYSDPPVSITRACQNL